MCLLSVYYTKDPQTPFAQCGLASPLPNGNPGPAHVFQYHVIRGELIATNQLRLLRNLFFNDLK